jgi:hypothetical protein
VSVTPILGFSSLFVDRPRSGKTSESAAKERASIFGSRERDIENRERAILNRWRANLDGSGAIENRQPPFLDHEREIENRQALEKDRQRDFFNPQLLVKDSGLFFVGQEEQLRIHHERF